MKFQLLYLVSAIGLIYMSSCCDPIVPPIEPPDPEPVDTTFQLKWDVFIEDSTRDYLSSSPTVFKDLVVLPVGSSSQNPTNFIVAFDKYTGKQVWRKDLGEYNTRSLYRYIIKGSLLIGSTVGEIYAFNLENQKLTWFRKGSFDAFVTLIGDHVYTSNLIQGQNSVVSYLTRFNIYTGSQEEIVSSTSSFEQKTYYSPPILYIDQVSSDSILLFTKIFSNNNNPFVPSDFVAYNLSKRKVLWQRVSFSPAKSAQNSPASIHDNDVIVVSDWHAYKFDIMTGDSIWKYQIENRTSPINNVVNRNPVLFGDKLIIQQTREPMHCVDARTGKAIWVNQKGSSTSVSGTSIVHKDMIVNTTSSGLLRAYDINNGLTFLSRSGLNGKNFIFDLSYDTETDMYYTVDFGHVYGFKINKPK